MDIKIMKRISIWRMFVF